MSAQGPQFHGTSKKTGEEGRFRENVVGQAPLPTRGQMFTKPLPGGRSLELRRQRPVVSTAHPFKVTTTAGEGGSSMFRVEPGTFNGITPTLGGTPLTEGPTAELGDNFRWVYLKTTWTLNVANDFVVSATLTSAIIEVKTAEEATPWGPNSTGVYYILLATFTDGAKTGQQTTLSLSGEVCGQGDGSAEARLVVSGVQEP